jgi:hypothetical protein
VRHFPGFGWRIFSGNPQNPDFGNHATLRGETMSLIAANDARLQAALEKRWRWPDGAIRTTAEQIAIWRAAGPIEKSEGDGMIDWSRRTFNRMDGNQQAAYEARLKAKRYYYLNNTTVPKIIYDSVEG